MAVKINLIKVWKQQEFELGRNITLKEVAVATGISHPTLIRLRQNKVKRPDLKVINKLCDFFGVTSGPVPFILYYEDVPTKMKVL